MRVFFVVVWHPGYTCRVAIRCTEQDLRTCNDLRMRIALALFDHGVCPPEIDRFKKQPLYYIRKGAIVPVCKPFRIPPNSTIVSNTMCIQCKDPDVFRIEIDTSTILPIRLPEIPLHTLDSIKQYISQQLDKQYHVKCMPNTFHVYYAKWTIGMPTRRNFTSGIVRVHSTCLNACEYHKAANKIQRTLLKYHRKRAARCIQAKWRSYVYQKLNCSAATIQRAWTHWRDTEWVAVMPAQTFAFEAAVAVA